MPETIVVSVSPKDSKNSARRKEVRAAACLGVSALYRLEGPLAPSQINRIAQELLCDPVVESYELDNFPKSPGEIFVDVWYKAGVMDPAGDSVLKAAKDLGVSSLSRASCGARYVFNGNIAHFASKELLNPLIQECKVRQA